MLHVRPWPLAALLVLACDSRVSADPSEGWWGGPEDLDVEEAITFTEEAYAPPPADVMPIAELRSTALAPTGDNDGPRIASQDWSTERTCAFWEEAPELPQQIEGVVTSYPRVYRKIEGCDGDEKYYGSFWMEDASGGIFVLRDSKVATFDVGSTVRLNVRGIRRRFGIDIVYVADLDLVAREPVPVHYQVAQRPLGIEDQSVVTRVTGTVVSEPTTFGEVLLQPDGWSGTCAPDDEITRESCVLVLLDQELGRRGITLAPGERVQVTGPVTQSPYFSPAGVFSFYGVYLTRVGQLERLD